jgi:hypothetical protein
MFVPRMIKPYWISPSDTRNFFNDEAIVDWLKLHGHKQGYTTNTPPMSKIVMQKGVEFEDFVVSKIRETNVAFYDLTKHKRDKSLHYTTTLRSLSNNDGVIYQPFVYDTNSKFYGYPDLIVHKSALQTLNVNNEEDFTNLNPTSDWVVVDIKFTSAKFANKYYRAQLVMYAICLSFATQTAISLDSLAIFNRSGKLIRAIPEDETLEYWKEEFEIVRVWLTRVRLGAGWSLKEPQFLEMMAPLRSHSKDLDAIAELQMPINWNGIQISFVGRKSYVFYWRTIDNIESNQFVSETKQVVRAVAILTSDEKFWFGYNEDPHVLYNEMLEQDTNFSVRIDWSIIERDVQGHSLGQLCKSINFDYNYPDDSLLFPSNNNFDVEAIKHTCLNQVYALRAICEKQAE